MSPQERKLRNARARVVQAHPFFGTLLLRQKVVETVEVETMATDGEHLFFNPAFVDRILGAELLGVIAHEALHPGLAHHLRRGDRDHTRWNIACDLAINPLLRKAGFTLPKEALDDPRFHGMSAEQIYPLLPVQGGGKGGDIGRPGSGVQVPSFGGTGAVIDAPVKSEAERSHAEAECRIALSQALAAAAGKVPGEIRALIEAELAPRVDWAALLRRFMQDVARDDETWSAPNRRFIGGGMYLPSLRSEKLPPALFVVDASGSMPDAALEDALSEVRGITEEVGIERLDVIVHDTRVTSEHSFSAGDDVRVDVIGRGGTLFAPVCEWINGREEPYSVVVWFTDLEPADWDDAAAIAPAAPLLWIHYGNRDHAPAFGDDVVKYEPREAA